MAHAPASRTLVCYRCPRARDLAGGGPPAREEKRCKAVWPAGLSIAPAVELCGLDSEKLVCRGFQPSEVLTSHAGTKGGGKRQDAPVTSVWEPRVISCSSSGVHLRRHVTCSSLTCASVSPSVTWIRRGRWQYLPHRVVVGIEALPLVRDRGAQRCQCRPRAVAGRG